MEPERRPSVGLGVIVQRGHHVLFGRRTGAHGEGTWSIPGGHLEFGESFAECAHREVLEETGVEINVETLSPVGFTNDIFTGADRGKHYVTLYFVAKYRSGEAGVVEPHKFEAVAWRRHGEIAHGALFLPLRNLIRQGVDLFNPRLGQRPFA